MKPIFLTIFFALFTVSCTQCGPCPEYAIPAPDWCEGGQVMSGGIDDCGCSKAAVCKMPECGDCPQYMPPGPSFCEGGKIVDGGKDRCGCQMPPKCELAEDKCAVDADCACGVHIESGDCFAGNVKYVDSTKQCPDFCTGIDGRMTIVCDSGTCKTIRA